ncbi:hypothetical protein A3D66_01035 [Candidatus Kaiserbacteria bacterium RIFCSPHIGHO2_02_FULL_50_9]|uniref:DUF1328 domain-containing protein n=1 Tax=Candidatus Kaiserbacteria bacterium RIFCSPLOWO2_01_FULL_51_21 TaxID=1798508 RepID=A0A1F6EEA6_9BACT|nr:MAG: hypothetical protein A2761_01830 [Candidatus Kaiserbacteria bacterium RIFCSPHIGHO2_01_FULL_51_33]OGG63238.1 MAG: hypothetical protein A3D66_01035 [Candidatus Kaiserbacteria bacterium RIFCSPHIGHO2_02_FULL_50_9]OGG71542.1 MAG: hypothetical protein A3A35_00130 [Candidatus Kaiserbacteria bacterium RIFCSPLOWO2_01_FULL_51_21]
MAWIFFCVALVAALIGFIPPDGASSGMWQILFYILLLLSLIFAGIGLLAKRGLGEHRGE